MMADLLKLAARCEAATGPDRELDRDIGLAMGVYDQPEDLGCFHDPAEAVVGGGGQTFAAPEYSASLDAAMTLVPEEMARGEFGRYDNAPGHWVILSFTEMDCVEGTGATVPLAFTAAALRAQNKD